MDRNQVIGFSLLAVLLIGYLMYNQHEQKVYFEKKRADSVANALKNPPPVKKDTVAIAQAPNAPVVRDSTTEAQRLAQPPSYYGEAKPVILENKNLALQFSTRGAFPVSAQLKKYKTYYQKPLYLFNGAGNLFAITLPMDQGKSSADLYYTAALKDEPNGGKSVDFSADLGAGKKLDIIYTLADSSYMMNCSIVLTGVQAGPVPLKWNVYGLHTEKDMDNERMSTQLYYRNKNGENDYFTVNHDEHKIANNNAPSHWLGLRKQYFSTVLINDDGFSKMDIKFLSKQADTNVAAEQHSELLLPLKANGNVQTANLRWFIGPNDYHTLMSYKIGMDDMVPLGVGIMAFVKYINKYALVPIFYFLYDHVGSMALVIMLLTIIVRLVLSFFTYKSYLSSAKMRVMKPELDELRLKIGDDKQKFSMEQMKLYRSAGVNPLGGCLPMLFQLPILLSMYYMFPSFIEFRQVGFLWCHDLSTYDSILNFGFNIPFYGDHISLWTLLMTASSLFLALYNRNMTPQDPNNPMMKYMPYVFPIILMGVFNKMAAALTFYYTFSNLMSMAQQFIIQKYFIDEKAIHAKLQENKNKPATPSKWAQKLEEIQKQQAQKAKPVPRTNKK